MVNFPCAPIPIHYEKVLGVLGKTLGGDTWRTVFDGIVDVRDIRWTSTAGATSCTTKHGRQHVKEGFKMVSFFWRIFSFILIAR